MSQASFATHEVFNQSPPFEDVDLFALDRPLVEAVAANGGAAAEHGTVGVRPALGLGGDGGARPDRQREHAETAHLRLPAATAATRSSFTRPITN